MNYGKALRIARAVAGVEQKQLATEAGLNPSHISLIESGARQPSVGAVAKLCRALKIPEPLFSMLAAESADLTGMNEQEFEKIGVYLARFLTRREPTTRKTRRKHSAGS
jgi:transcriptional regulator with XRE-family HTH domain